MIDLLPVAPAWLLLAAGVLLYLADLAQLLYVNELLFVRAGTRWQAVFPCDWPELARRYLVLPNPLRPDEPILRLAWRRRADPEPRCPETLRADLETRLGLLVPLRWCCLVLLVILFGAAPLGYLRFQERGFLGVLAAAYLLAVLALLWVARVRSRVSLGRGALLLLAFESLICIPYSINLYRKLALRSLPRDLDAALLARTLLASSEQDAFAARLDDD